jgi:hypothetical protein
MAEIEFSIDTETGNCETKINGVQGPACEKAAQQLKQILGAPSTDRKTKEYFVKRKQIGRVKPNE